AADLRLRRGTRRPSRGALHRFYPGADYPGRRTGHAGPLRPGAGLHAGRQPHRRRHREGAALLSAFISRRVMAFDFRLPDLGEGVHEGEVLRWLVREGDTVSEDQPLVEVMTDKVTTELPSPRAGAILKICVPEGGVIPVGTTMVTIG